MECDLIIADSRILDLHHYLKARKNPLIIVQTLLPTSVPEKFTEVDNALHLIKARGDTLISTMIISGVGLGLSKDEAHQSIAAVHKYLLRTGYCLGSVRGYFAKRYQLAMVDSENVAS
jgi:hypothetical protein